MGNGQSQEGEMEQVVEEKPKHSGKVQAGRNSTKKQSNLQMSFGQQQANKQQQQQQQEQQNQDGDEDNDQSEYQDESQSAQKPLDSQASFRQNQMNISNNQQAPVNPNNESQDSKQTSKVGSLYQTNTRKSSDRQLSQYSLTNNKGGRGSQLGAVSKAEQEQLAQLAENEQGEEENGEENQEDQQQNSQDIYDNDQQQYQDNNDYDQQQQEQMNQQQYDEYQERKQQIVQEQLSYMQTDRIDKPKKLNKWETDQMVYKLHQRGKEIDYRNKVLQQQQQNKEIEGCNFQPSNKVPLSSGSENVNVSTSVENNSIHGGKSVVKKSLAQQQPKRSFQSFLSEQDKFLAKRSKGIQETKDRVQEKEVEGFTGKPKLCHKSENMVKKINERQGKKNIPVYKKLYELNNNKITAKKQEQRKDENNILEITQKQLSQQIAFQENRIKEEAANRLYLDFKRRQDKYKEQEQYFKKKPTTNTEQSQSGVLDPASQTKKKNDMALAKQLLKQFDTGIVTLQEEYNKNLQLLDYIQMSEILKLLKFTSEHTRVESSNFIKERSLINDLWIILEGQKNEFITGRNLVLALLGVLGIQVDIPKFTPNPEDVEDYQKNKNSFPNQFSAQSNNQSVRNSNLNQNQIDKAIPLTRDSDLFEEQQQIQFQQQQYQQEQKNIEDQQLNNSQIPQNQDDNINNNEQEGQTQQSQQGSQQNIVSQSQTPQAKNQYGQSQQKTPQSQASSAQMENFYNQRYSQLIVGTYDETHNLMLEEDDIAKLQAHFHVMYLNRLNNKVDLKKKKTDLQNQKSKNLQGSQNLSEQNMSMRSNAQRTEQMAFNHRMKLIEVAKLTGGVDAEHLSNYDLMLAHKEIKDKNQQMIREMYQDKEMEECTFAPQTQPYTGQGSQYQGDLRPYQEDSKQSFKNHKTPITAQSLGGERYLSLYNLAKPRSQLRDKNTDEVEYEKNCDECTFAPDIINARNQNIYHQSRLTYVKNGDQTVNRIRTANDKNSENKQFKDRGYDYYNQRQGTGLGSTQFSRTSQKQFKPSSSSRLQKQQDQQEQDLMQQQYEQQQQQQYQDGMNGQENDGGEQIDEDSERVKRAMHNNNNNYQHDNEDQDNQPQQQQQQNNNNNNNPNFKPDYTFGNKNNQQQQQQQQQLQQQDEQYDDEQNDNQQQQQDDDNHQDNYYQQNNQQDDDDHSHHQNDQNNNGEGEQQDENEVPMLYVDVNLSADRVERIIVKKGDDIHDIADSFIEQHQLDPNIREKLVELLNAQISQFMSNQEQ